MSMFAQSDDDELEGLLQVESPGLPMPVLPLSTESLPDTSSLS
jgi:hypothetical protein